jgi:hypothetical protein
MATSQGKVYRLVKAVGVQESFVDEKRSERSSTVTCVESKVKIFGLIE